MNMFNSTQAEQFEAHVLETASKINLPFEKLLFQNDAESEQEFSIAYSVGVREDNITFYYRGADLVVYFNECSLEDMTQKAMKNNAIVGLTGLLTLNDLGLMPDESLYLPVLGDSEKASEFLSLFRHMMQSYVNLYRGELHAKFFGKEELGDYAESNWAFLSGAMHQHFETAIYEKSPFDAEDAFYFYLPYSFFHKITDKQFESSNPWISDFSSVIYSCFQEIKALKASWIETANLLGFTFYGLRSKGDIPNSIANNTAMQPYSPDNTRFCMRGNSVCTFIQSDESRTPYFISTPNLFSIYDIKQIETANRIGKEIIDYFSNKPRVEYDAY